LAIRKPRFPSFKDKDGEPAGYSVELCKRVATAIATKSGGGEGGVGGAHARDAVEAVATGKVDVECSTTTVTLARREKVDFSLPIFVDAATVMSRGTSAKTLADLQGKKIAVAEGTTTSPLSRAGSRSDSSRPKS
jgi:polar amino acid transport system substrate-binding protein/glutamate/aspartate transport system substrate-binding protein